MTTIAIKLPLVDERACTGCPMLVDMWSADYCRAFDKRIPLTNTTRLPECLAAQVEEPDHG